MNRNSSGHLCVTCEHTFATNNGLEKHIEDKHTGLWCDHCGALFRNKAELNKHTENCDELGMEATECKKCNKKMVRWGSKKHKCQPQKEVIACNICERIFKTTAEVKKHVADEHRSKQDKSNIVCRHYRNGNCVNGDRCEYSHVGFVKNHSPQEQVSSTTKKASICRHGENCSWLARGACAFFHRGVGVQKPIQKASQQNQQEFRQIRPRGQQQTQSGQQQSDNKSCPKGPTCIHLARGSCKYGGVFYHVRRQQQQSQQQSSGQDTRLCWEDANCVRTACKFTHLSLQDFPNLPKPSRPHGMGNLNQRRFLK